MRCYVDVHILQTVPPSNINRDDAGTPKQATYGGVRRARVSSQAWKRATRTAFVDHVDPAQLGTRTKKISAMLAERIEARGNLGQEVSSRIATSVLAELGIKAGKKATETSYLLFFGRPQLERLIDHFESDLPRLVGLDDKELAAAAKEIPLKEVLGAGHPIDVALFGRMVADLPALNVDAATQVAHALSTHAAEIEFDYFTAVDDENPKEDTGAGMIGTVEFQSATLYRFATVGLHQLLDNLGGDTEAAVAALKIFLTTFTTSMPTGHENSFAHRTTPSLLSVVLRGDQPVNLVSAFEEPVSTQKGIVAASIDKFAKELADAADQWGLRPELVASTYRQPDDAGRDKTLSSVLGPSIALDKVIETVSDAAREKLAGGAR